MSKRALVLAACMGLLASGVCSDLQAAWEEGGPKYLYVKPKKKPPHHGLYDEELKCIACHSYDGIDAYTSATMSMKKTRKGRMPRREIEHAVLEALKGKGDYREIFVISTSFDNQPLATVIEFVLDPQTFTFYAMSEKQTEKLFQIASNPAVSMASMKQRADHDYFGGALGVQIVGTARLLTGDDPEFAEAARIYVPTLPPPPGAPGLPPLEVMLEAVMQTKIITKVVPERIVILNRSFKAGGYHAAQIWEAGIP